jgi:putative ATP-dependent endonuclease of OLD family
MRASSNRTLGKLLKQILQTVQAQVQPQLDEAYRNAQSLLNVVQVDEDGRLAERDERVPDLRRIESTVTTYLQETFPRARARLRVDLPAVDEILGQVALTVLDGGVETPMHRQGHGLQRALYLGLLQTLAEEIRRQGQAGLVRPFLLMVEEPELFLHPAAQERMRDALETISTKGQVLVATHSPLMVSPKSLRQVILLEKTPSPSTGKEETRRRGALGRQGPTATERELISLLNLQRSSQIFFSDTVVLVEGIGDMYLLQAIVERVARSSPSSLGLGIVEVGGKDKLLKFKAILDELGLRTYAVADLDFLAEGAGEAFGGDARYSQFCEQLNRRVADLCPDLGDADARTRARRRLMTELCREELRQQRDELCARLACQGIFVLREGEMHEYAGLTDTSKGRYLIAAREIVDRERAVKHLDEIGQIVGSLSGLAASAAEPPQEGINT